MTRFSKPLVLLVGLFLLSSAGTFFGLRAAAGPEGSGGSGGSIASLISPLVPGAGKGKVNVAEGAPKTEACPLNGQMYTKAERDAWEQRTPIAIMIENHVDARPQSGLSSADVVFEAIAEGGITRFMAMIYCDAQTQDIILAPVRSARTYFIDWASSYGKPLYTHVGGANVPGPSDALGQLEKYGWAGKNDLNQFSIGFPTFARNYNRVQLASDAELATEHTMETSSERIWEYAKTKRNITTWTDAKTFKPWTFKEDGTDGSATSVSYEFWDGFKDFAIQWTYDSATNQYARVLGGQPHVDLNNNEQIKVKNVVVLFATEKGPINENKHMLYGTTGTGDAIIFRDGEAVKAKWSKPTRTDALQFTVNGKPAEFNRGPIWISTLAIGTTVNY